MPPLFPLGLRPTDSTRWQPSEPPAADAVPDSQKLAGIKQKHVLPVQGDGQQVGSAGRRRSQPALLCGHRAAGLAGTERPEQDVCSALRWKLFKCNYAVRRGGIDDLEVPHKLNLRPA